MSLTDTVTREISLTFCTLRLFDVHKLRLRANIMQLSSWCHSSTTAYCITNLSREPMRFTLAGQGRPNDVYLQVTMPNTYGLGLQFALYDCVTLLDGLNGRIWYYAFTTPSPSWLPLSTLIVSQTYQYILPSWSCCRSLSSVHFPSPNWGEHHRLLRFLSRCSSVVTVCSSFRTVPLLLVLPPHVRLSTRARSLRTLLSLVTTEIPIQQPEG